MIIYMGLPELCTTLDKDTKSNKDVTNIRPIFTMDIAAKILEEVLTY
jgi:hypothetical protein